MLLHIPNVLSTAEVQEFRRLIEAADWQDGRASVGAQGALVKQNRQLPEGSELAMQLGGHIISRLSANPLFSSAAIPLRILPPFFNAYSGGEHYGLHVDGAIRKSVATGEFLRTDLSATLFLCDPEEYEGGELVVVDTYGSHEVKLPAGDLVLYPSTSLHQVMPVTRGTRVGSFFWIQSMIRDDQKRSMLFELDQTIQQLRAAGDSEQTVALTNHYHNLIRMWADV